MIESNILHFIMSVVLFPTLFQDTFMNFAWGADSILTIQIAKRLFLLLPVLSFITACWITIVALISVVFRHNHSLSKPDFLNGSGRMWILV